MEFIINIDYFIAKILSPIPFCPLLPIDAKSDIKYLKLFSYKELFAIK